MTQIQVIKCHHCKEMVKPGERHSCRTGVFFKKDHSYIAPTRPTGSTDDFFLSYVVASTTDNAFLGYAVGGSMMGGLLGASNSHLRDTDSHRSSWTDPASTPEPSRHYGSSVSSDSGTSSSNSGSSYGSSSSSDSSSDSSSSSSSSSSD
jgi:hypothetical protein